MKEPSNCQNMYMLLEYDVALDLTVSCSTYKRRTRFIGLTKIWKQRARVEESHKTYDKKPIKYAPSKMKGLLKSIAC